MRNSAIIIGIGVGIAAAIAVSTVKYLHEGQFLPGTMLAKTSISYTTPEQARAVFYPKTQEYLNTALTIEALGKTAELTPSELGVEIALSESLDAIQRFDWKKNSVIDLFGGGGGNYPLLVTINRDKLNHTLEEKFQLNEIAPRSASFYFEKKNLTIKEGENGVALDRDKLIKEIKSSAQSLGATSISLALNEATPAVTTEMLEAQKDETISALDHWFTLIDPVYSDDWDVRLRDNLEWVNFVERQKHTLPFSQKAISTAPVPGVETASYIAIEINQTKLNEYVDEEISKWLDRPGEDVKIHTDEDGDVVIEGKGSDGLKVQRTQLKRAIELAVENRIADVPIPVLRIEPGYEISPELQALGITERLTVGHTSFYGSPRNRVHNIRVGAEQFNGKVIAPDEVFSFNQNLGRVDGTTGYRKELVIKSEGTIPEYGGGICQVSTTMYRSILQAGLPIEERNQHSYAVSYYSQIGGHGLDATIYLGGADLQFRNDTGNHMLVQTYMEGDYELYIAFYGTTQGKTVRLEGPYISNHKNPPATIYEETTELLDGETKQVERNHTGFQALWYRHITSSDGTVTTEPIKTTYRAVPAKILVGTRDKP